MQTTAEQLVGISEAVALNTAKVGITAEQSDAIIANTAKTGISSGQADAIPHKHSKGRNHYWSGCCHSC